MNERKVCECCGRRYPFMHYSVCYPCWKELHGMGTGDEAPVIHDELEEPMVEAGFNPFEGGYDYDC